MTDTAVHLVGHVLPEVPIRQWVCSLPWRLRFLCGYDRTLCTEVLTAFVGELGRSLRARAKRELGLASVAGLLERLGRSLDPEADVLPDALELEHPALADCNGAACRGIDLLGARAGEPTLRIVEPLAGRPNEPVARVAGFNVHAGLVVDGRDRKRLERVCRYAGRPPIAQERLERLADGRLHSR
jgi:hypothetical protein